MKKILPFILFLTIPFFSTAQELLSVDDVMKLEAGMPTNAFEQVIKDASARKGLIFNLSNCQDEDIPDELLDLVADKSKLRSYGTEDFSIQVYENKVVYFHVILENITEVDQTRLDKFYDSQWEKDSRLKKRSLDTWMNKGNAYSYKRHMDGAIQIHSADLKFIPTEKVEQFKEEIYNLASLAT